MKFSTVTSVGVITLLPNVFAQSVCDKYTQALFNGNTATDQYKLVAALVNTALIGNYSKGAKNAVNGILVPGDYNGQAVNLLPYFNGGLLSTNRNNAGSSVNFIDGGGAIPLAQGMPASDTTSNQYKLVTHLYQYFGAALGCSSYGMDGFPAYQGSTKMYETHKFMNSNHNEMNYFIQQVGLSAASFGVSTADITTVANYLNSTFNYRCTPAAPLIPSAAPDLQAMCINSDCPVATSGAVCGSYNKANNGEGRDPATASSTPGPQLTALAAQLASISSSVNGASGASGASTAMGSVTTGTSIVVSDSSTRTEVYTSTMGGSAGGAMTSSGGASGSGGSGSGAAATPTSAKAAGNTLKMSGGVLAAGLAAAAFLL